MSSRRPRNVAQCLQGARWRKRGETGGTGTAEREGRVAGPLQKCPQPRERGRFGLNRLPGGCPPTQPGLASATAAESRFRLPPCSHPAPHGHPRRRAPLRTSHTAHRRQPPSSRARPSPAPVRRAHVTPHRPGRGRGRPSRDGGGGPRMGRSRWRCPGLRGVRGGGGGACER